jgi:hypothetical protein
MVRQNVSKRRFFFDLSLFFSNWEHPLIFSLLLPIQQFQLFPGVILDHADLRWCTLLPVCALPDELYLFPPPVGCLFRVFLQPELVSPSHFRKFSNVIKDVLKSHCKTSAVIPLWLHRF